ncbi:PASTA domain-containing protein [Micromonospora sp. DT233]|uniref:PASTA domain-containing protein n=1 Tax=Micromonospora sp. DT233 TaxID=3393432 RepID=UPI003CE8D558
MTDEDSAGRTYAEEPGRDAGAGRRSRLIGGGLALALLAVVGTVGGWLLAGREGSPPPPPSAASSAASPTPAATEATPSPPPTTRPATRTSAPASATGLTVPPVVGSDFEDARDELRDRRLGWRLVFGTGLGRDVLSADPPVGTAVKRGTTVALYVAGPAPRVSVPDLLGDDCSDAADDLVDEGLYPRYRTGRTGTVTAQDPAPDSPAYWNGEVSLTCGNESEEPEEPDVEPTPTS